MTIFAIAVCMVDEVARVQSIMYWYTCRYELVVDTEEDNLNAAYMLLTMHVSQHRGFKIGSKDLSF